MRCDHCADMVPTDGGVAYDRLPFDISSACEGESAVICDLCNDDFTAVTNKGDE